MTKWTRHQQEAQAETEISDAERVGEMGMTMSGSIKLQKKIEASQRKQAEEVAAGRRDPRSLFLFPKGYFDKVTLEENPESEFSRPGKGW